MGYHHVRVSDLDPDRPSTKRSGSDACGFDRLAAHADEES